MACSFESPHQNSTHLDGFNELIFLRNVKPYACTYDPLPHAQKLESSYNHYCKLP